MQKIKKYIPLIIKKVILNGRQKKLYKKINKNYKSILRELEISKNEKRIILIGTSVFGNLGDQAISKGQIELLRDNFSEVRIIEIPLSLYRMEYKNLGINENDLLLVNGGGFMGTLWMEAQSILDTVVLNHPDNRVIIMPQSVYYHENKTKILDYHKRIFASHKNLSLITRDERSYNFIKENNFHFKNILLTPDIVTYLDGNRYNTSNEEIIFILRDDLEKVSTGEDINTIKSLLSKVGIRSEEYRTIDTIVSGTVDKFNRDNELDKFLKTVGKAKLVISDRLHGIILSVICGIPVIVMDNISKKTYGAFQWLKDLGYVYYYDDPELEGKLIKILSGEKTYKYDNSFFREQHEKIIELIREEYQS